MNYVYFSDMKYLISIINMTSPWHMIIKQGSNYVTKGYIMMADLTSKIHRNNMLSRHMPRDKEWVDKMSILLRVS